MSASVDTTLLAEAFTALERAQFDAHDREWARGLKERIADTLAASRGSSPETDDLFALAPVDLRRRIRALESRLAASPSVPQQDELREALTDIAEWVRDGGHPDAPDDGERLAIAVYDRARAALASSQGSPGDKR